MTPYEHIWAFAKSLKVNDMDEFIAMYENRTGESMSISVRGEFKSHSIGDILQAVRFCREEYRKDQRMKTEGEK